MQNIEQKYNKKNNAIFTFFLCLSVISIPMSFPLQVLFIEPYMALLPYLFLFIALLFILPIYNIYKLNFLIFSTPNILFFFILFVLFNQTIQFAFNFIELNEFISSILFLSLPILFYLPFRFYLNKHNFRLILIFLIAAGFINAVFYIFDTVSRFIFFEITSYSQLAFDYSIEQQEITNLDDANTARISTLSRSHGLMPSHTISSFWIMVSYFALMTLRNFKNFEKIVLTAIYFCILLVCMNFSSIIIFMFLAFFIYFDFFKLLFLRIAFTNLIFIFFGIFFLIALITFILINNENPLIKYFIDIVIFQINLLFDTGGFRLENMSTGTEATFSQQYFENFLAYIGALIEYPMTIIIGTGFSGTIIGYGGDTGIIETLAKFGPLMFIIFMFAYLRIIILSIKKMQLTKNEAVRNKFKFIISIMLSILIYEFHYSIWDQKYVFPLIIFAVAMFDSLNQSKKKPDIQSSV